MTFERLQKIIARAGRDSRRGAEQLIAAGRVRVNGVVVTEPGSKADAQKDKIEVDGIRLVAEELVYVVLHKPRGVVSTMVDPEGRPTVADLVADLPMRLFPVGRLDFATSGVLLMTNDGAFTQAVLHPKCAVPKIYVVKLDKKIDEQEIVHWCEGIELDDGPTLPAEVRLLRHERGKSWLTLQLREGRNQQIRRMAAARGFVAMRLARLSFAGIDAEGLRPGQWRLLNVDELRKLKRSYGVPKRVRAQRKLQSIQVKAMARSSKARADKHARKRGGKRKAAKAGAPGSAAQGTRAARNDRSGTTPRATGRRGSRGPGRGRR